MQAFLAAVYQRRARQLQLVDDGVLRLDVQAVAFHQSVAVLRHVVVFATLTIQRVEAYPCAGLRVIISYDRPNVSAAVGQGFDQLTGRAVPAPLCGQIPPIAHPASGDKTHIFRGLEQRFQVFDQLTGGVPVFRDVEFTAFHPAAVYDRF